jgi:hypothetical protein
MSKAESRLMAAFALVYLNEIEGVPPDKLKE